MCLNRAIYLPLKCLLRGFLPQHLKLAAAGPLWVLHARKLPLQRDQQNPVRPAGELK